MTTAESDLIARLAVVEGELAERWPESRLEPSLDRIRALVDLLGDPQRAAPVVHLTGTNGKTSTARMVEALLRAFDLSTGLTTSPHLHTVRERIRLSGEPVDVERFVAAYDEIAPYLDLVDGRSVAAGGPRLSYFEALTGLSFAVFADAPVDVAVVEVGMGGAWDATNVADGVVAVVTRVGLDHMDYLGDTVEEIAYEKAGIIKPAATAVLAAQEADAARVLLERCAEVEATPVREGLEFGLARRELAVGGQVLTIDGLAGTYDGIVLPLHGEHQAHNAALALAAVESFFGGGRGQLDVDRVRDGFAAVTSPGRLEVLRRSPTVMVDAAHNPAGAAALAAALRESFAFTHLVGVLAILGDKDVRGILEALEPVMTEVVVTANRSPRALDVDELADLAASVFGESRVHVAAAGLGDAIDLAVGLLDETSVASGGGVLVTGSVVTAAEARAMLGRTET